MSFGDAEDEAQPESPELVTLAEVERRHVERVFAHTGGCVQEAAHILGISRKTLSASRQRWREARDATFD